MNRTVVMKDRRLIEALDYIDDEYIASAALYKMRAYAESARPPAQTAGQSIKKYWKQLAALAACLILLAFASPVFNKVAEIITSFAAGWGSGMTEEISERSDTEEVPYLQFSPDLEPISQELVEEINDAFIPFFLDMTKDELLAILGENAEEKYNKRWRVIRNYDLFSPYYGTFGDCIIFGMFADGDGSKWSFVEIEGYEFDRFTYVYVNKELYYLDEAYEKGLLSDVNISLLSKRCDELLRFTNENRDKYPW